MVYKRYIVRNGRKYGPYLYESKRVNGKVIGTYVKEDSSTKNNFNFVYLLLGILGVTLLAFFAFQSFQNSVTGNFVLTANNVYDLGDQVSGELELVLKAGELIPASSTVDVSLGDQVVSLPLSSLVSVETSEGEFYTEGISLSGNGVGYGVSGIKTLYPEVSFDVLLKENVVDSSGGSDSSAGSGSDGSEEVVEESTEVEASEEVVEDIEDSSEEEDSRNEEC